MGRPFGVKMEHEKMDARLIVMMTQQMRDDFADLAYKKDMTVSELLREVIQEAIDNG